MRVFLYFLLCVNLIKANEFSDYWYSGKAEVAVYDLEQWGYGEVRKGTSTLIFVTEPFSNEEHVKLDHPSSAGSDKVTVMKMNRIKKYTTGLYPYSLMTSAFCRVDDGELLKLNTSLQEWCGQTFMQANLKKADQYTFTQYSYFQEQGDQQKILKVKMMEEEIFLRIRLGNLNFESGKFIKSMPAQEYIRLLLLKCAPVNASITLEELEQNMVYTITYDHPSQLKTRITALKSFPHTIQEWTESYQRAGKLFTNKSSLKTVQRLPYWQMNALSDSSMRKTIGLE